MSFPPFIQLEPVEVLAMPKNKIHSAKILLGRYGEGWVWAAHYQRHFGDYLGYSGLLGHCEGRAPQYLEPTREAAIASACALIRRGMEDAPLNAWLDTLTPKTGDQIDLFGEAA